MATAAVPGFTGQMFASTSGVASSSSPAGLLIAELGDVTLSLTMEELNAFSKDSGGWDEYVPGKRAWTAQGSAIYKDVSSTSASTGQPALYDAITGRTNVGVTFRTNTSSGVLQYHGAALVTKWDLRNPNNGVDTVDFGLRGTGALVRAVSTS